MSHPSLAALALRGFYVLLPHLTRWTEGELRRAALEGHENAAVYLAVAELRVALAERGRERAVAAVARRHK